MSPTVLITPSLLGALAAALLAVAQQNTVSQGPVQAAPSVSELTVGSGLAPVPNVGIGAPRYSGEDLEAIAKQSRQGARQYEEELDYLQDCFPEGPKNKDERELWALRESDAAAAHRLTLAAKAAEQASDEFLELRRKVPLGQATQAELEAGELKRQAAVNEMVAARAAMAKVKERAVLMAEFKNDGLSDDDIDARMDAEDAYARRQAERRALNPVPPRYAGLTVEKVSARGGKDRRGDYLRVTGQVRNTTSRSTSRPLLSFTALDINGFTLEQQVAHAGGRIAPGAAYVFAFEMRPRPDLTKTVEVTFADREPPTFFRRPQACSRFGPDVSYQEPASTRR